MNKNDFELFQEFMAFKETQEGIKKKKKRASKYAQRADGYYCTQVTVGFDEDTGKRIRKTLYAKTAAELDNKVAEVRVDLMSGKKFHSQRITFKPYAEKWLKQREPFLEHKTYIMYETILRVYCTSINDIELKDITKSDIQDIINQNITKPRTCQQIRLTIKQIMDCALDDDLIYKNPVRKIELPKYEKPQKRALTTQEDALSDITEFTDREKAYILLIKWNGLRKEEALALTVNDFDFKKNVITINKAVTFVDNEPKVKSTKTSAGNRVLPLLEHVVAFFKYYLSNLSSEWLFTSLSDGKPITEQSFKKMWQSIIRKMNKKGKELKYDVPLTGLTSHIFRHNYASMLYQVGVNPKEAQYLLGHASINVTMDIYTHINTDDLQVTKLLKPSS